tara:strand:+ start:271 stop:579 length:309 start_codon:yes stop_codon:yes gene_type:complete
MTELIEWDMYEVNSERHPLTGNCVRGRLRKFALQNNINLLVENTQDGEPRIRFAVISGTDISLIQGFLTKLFDDVKIEKVFEKIKNPVLARTQVNLEERYEI